jgi:transcriptional regulator with XRE-family HTH domain
MGSHERRLDRARRLVRRALLAIGEELREARIAAGLSQRELGAIVGRSHTQIGRIERGEAPQVPYETLVMIGVALGLDIPLRAYPSGDPVRDAGQLALLVRFRSRISPNLRHRTEVPIGLQGDLRAWDEVLLGPGWSIPVEAETRIRDTQALRRKLALKLGDSGFDRMILLIADTRHNRHVLRIAAAEFGEAFPTSGRDALASLRRGERPSGSAIAFA